MIEKLDHSNLETAEKMYVVFQSSYAIEAEILGAEDFPPLKRTVTDLQKSDTSFYGFWKGESLAAVVEIETLTDSIHICSLVVDPRFFRQGIARKLLLFAMESTDRNLITVETGVENKPATTLYEQFGFKEVKQYLTPSEIVKIRYALKT